MKLIDTHAHLDLEAYDDDREEVCLRSTQNLQAVINIGISSESSKACIELAYKYDNFYAAIGIHPNDAENYTEKDWELITHLAEDPRVVAIGETGFDFYHGVPFEPQKKLLDKHLRLAAAVGKPVILHSRQASMQLIDFLREWFGKHTFMPCLVHCFGEETDIAKAYLDMGFYIALGGAMTFPKSKILYPMIESLPKNRIMLETDSPFLAPQLVRGKRNEPSYIEEVAKLAAQVRGENLRDVIEYTSENAKKFFGI